MYRVAPWIAVGLGILASPLVAHAGPQGVGGPGSRDPGAAYNAPAAAQAAPVAAPAPQAGGYGGGFLELLMTGHASGQATTYRPGAQPMGRATTDMSRYMAYAETVAVKRVDPMFLKQDVTYSGKEKPGTIVIDTPHKFLFLVEPGGHALRYGIGVGRPGFAWAGVKTITRKAEWPGWTPPAEMLERRPDLPRHMDGGPANPLGARAMYLGSTLYRIHGTNEPETIGTNVSSGCIRMMNEDVIDLYGRVGVGTKVIVM